MTTTTPDVAAACAAIDALSDLYLMPDDALRSLADALRAAGDPRADAVASMWPRPIRWEDTMLWGWRSGRPSGDVWIDRHVVAREVYERLPATEGSSSYEARAFGDAEGRPTHYFPPTIGYPTQSAARARMAAALTETSRA